MKQLLTRQQVQKEVHPTSYRPHLPHQAPDVWVWKTTLSPKATFKHSDHKQHTDAGEKARVCKTEVQEVFTKLSTSSRPWRLPGPGTAGRVLCQTDRKTLLHSIPGIGYVGKAVPRQGQGLQNAEDERESLVMPPKGRTQGKGKTQLEERKTLINTVTTWGDTAKASPCLANFPHSPPHHQTLLTQQPKASFLSKRRTTGAPALGRRVKIPGK